MGKTFNLAETFGDALRAVPNSGTGREQIEYIDEALISGDARNFYELSGLEDLAANIELIGLQQPIRVRPDPDDAGGYLIVSGHRRMAAIRQHLKPEAPDKWAQIPCIVERDDVSPAMQELRLIYANSATREMSNADKAKQVERVTELLYKLKGEGVSFPGRMRDHVAEACQISKSKLSRLKVINDRLIDELRPLWDAGKLSEDTAYTIAHADEEYQRALLRYYGKSLGLYAEENHIALLNKRFYGQNACRKALGKRLCFFCIRIRNIQKIVCFCNCRSKRTAHISATDTTDFFHCLFLFRKELFAFYTLM